MSIFGQLVLNGVTAGAVYALVAVGVTLVYGLTGIVNFAHGQLVTLGAYVTWQSYAIGIPLYAAILIGMLVMGIVGVLLERGVFRWSLRRPITGFIASIGLIPVFGAVVLSVWGPDTRSAFPPLRGSTVVLGVVLNHERLLLAGTTLLVVLAAYLTLTRTQLGRSVRAASEDREMSAALGINVRRLIILVFFVGSAVAGLGGGLILSIYPVTSDLGSAYIFKALAIMMLGGLGNVMGTVIAAILLGIVEAMVAGYFSSAWSDVVVILAMMTLLMLRPTGILRGGEGPEIR